MIRDSESKIQDDAAEQARDRMALLELSQAGVNLLEFTHFITEKLEQDQETVGSEKHRNSRRHLVVTPRRNLRRSTTFWSCV